MKIVLFANTDWYLFNFRLALARSLREMGHEVLLVSPPGQYGARLAELGFRWESLKMRRRSLNPLTEILVLLRLARLFRRERPDVVHGFTIKCSVYGSIAARLCGASGRVSAVTGLGYVFTSRSFLARVLRTPVRGLLRISLGGDRARLILQNEDDREIFENERLCDPAKIRVIPGSGVDCTRFVPSIGKAIASPPRVLMAARVLWDKGVGEYVECARILKTSGREIQFLLAGSPDPGNPAAVPPEMLEAWDREGLLTCLGHVDDMAALLRDVDIVVLPSYREGLPKGLIEAAACALPMIAADVPGSRSVIRHRETGLLVAPRSALELASAIEEFVDDYAMALSLGAKARIAAVSSFSDAVIIARTLEVYSELARVSATGADVSPQGGR